DTATITETVLQPTTTSVTADPNPSVAGQPVTYTATVSPVPTGGTVTFTDGNTIIPGCDALALATDGTATCTTAGLSLGEHSITASYSGHDYYDGSADTLTHTVNQIATSLGLTAQPNPSVWGQAVTFTATLAVTSQGATAPSGTVAFTDGGTAIPGCESQPLDPTTRTATCTTAALGTGAHPIGAAYSGDATYAP